MDNKNFEFKWTIGKVDEVAYFREQVELNCEPYPEQVELVQAWWGHLFDVFNAHIRDDKKKFTYNLSEINDLYIYEATELKDVFGYTGWVRIHFRDELLLIKGFERIFYSGRIKSAHDFFNVFFTIIEPTQFFKESQPNPATEQLI
jgi:hypothetical protein